MDGCGNRLMLLRECMQCVMNFFNSICVHYIYVISRPKSMVDCSFTTRQIGAGRYWDVLAQGLQRV